MLWYGRFGSVADLVRGARSVRRLRWLANVGLGLIGLWIGHITAIALVPGYVSLVESAPYVYGLLFLAALLGLGLWLFARVVRWRLMRRARGVVWLRGPLESADRARRGRDPAPHHLLAGLLARLDRCSLPLRDPSRSRASANAVRGGGRTAWNVSPVAPRKLVEWDA